MYEFSYPEISTFTPEQINSSVARKVVKIEQKLDELEQMKNEKDADIELINNYIDYYKKQIDYVTQRFNVVIDIRKNKDAKIDYNAINKIIESGKIIGRPVSFFVYGGSYERGKDAPYGPGEDPVPMLFSQEAIDNLIDLHNYLVERDENGLSFMEDNSRPENAWTFDQVIDANAQIDAIVNHIKSMNFSPFETAMFLHQYISSQFPYNESEERPYDSRSIVGVLTTDKIVCVGYARLMKAVIDKLNMPGLKCSTFISVLTENEEAENIFKDQSIVPGSGHMQNLIQIIDKKYNIDGSYIDDTCWDATTDSFPAGKGIANFMYPVGDLLQYNGLNFDQPGGDGIDQLLSMFGIRNLDKNELLIIKQNINKSNPITIQQYKKCLYSLYKSMSPELTDVQLKSRVKSVMNLSMVVACTVFSPKAKGSIAKAGNEKYGELLKSLKDDPTAIEKLINLEDFIAPEK